MHVRHFEPCLHEERTTVCLSLTRERFEVDAVKLRDLVETVRVKSRHLYTREMLVFHCFKLPPEEHRLRLVRRYEHLRGEVIALVRRVEAVEVTKLNNRSDCLVALYCLSAESLLLLRHILWLNLHTETS